jgi:hypothetical protein
MKKLILAICAVPVLLLPILIGTSYAGQFLFDEFMGWQTVEEPLLIPVNKSCDMTNIDIADNSRALLRRKGTTKLFDITYPSFTVTSMGILKNDTYDLLLLGYDGHVETVDTSFRQTVIVSTKTAGYVWDFAQNLETVYGTNGNDTPFYFDGATVAYSTTMPVARSIVFYNNTCFMANTTLYPARVFISVWGEPLNWTEGPDTVDGDSFDIANYGEQVIDMKVLGASIIVLCSNSIMKITGDANPYQVDSVDQSIGCKSKGSVALYREYVYFMGTDAQYYKTDGYVVTPVSKMEIDDAMNATAVANSVAGFKILTTEADFSAGISSGVSTSATPGSVIPTPGNTVYTSTTDWNTFTLVNIDSITVPGVILSSAVPIVFDSFDDGNYTADPIWTPQYDTLLCKWTITADCTLRVVCETFSGLATNNLIDAPLLNVSNGAVDSDMEYTVSVARSGQWDSTSYICIMPYVTGADFVRIYFDGNGTVYTTISKDGTTHISNVPAYTLPINTYVTVHFEKSGSLFYTYINGNLKNTIDATGSAYPSLQSGSTTRLQVGVRAENTQNYSINANFDHVTTHTLYKTTGTAISPIINTGTDRPIWGLISGSSVTYSSSSVTYFARCSTQSTLGDDPAWVQQTNGGQISGIGSKQYLQFKASMTTTNLCQPAQLNDVTLNWATTGYYITEAIPTPNNNAWGKLEVTGSDDGTIDYTVYVSSIEHDAAFLVNTATWTVATNNTVLTIGTSNYLYIKSTFTITSASQALSIDSLKVNWYTGVSALNDVTTEWFDDRLYMGIMGSSVTSSANDTIFVYDPSYAEGIWWRYTDVYPSVLKSWNNDFYVASSTYGMVAQFLDGETDCGEPINAYYNFGPMTVGSLQVVSSFNNVTFGYKKMGSGMLGVDYYLNGNTTESGTYQLDMSKGKPIAVKSFLFPQETNANYIGFKLYNIDGADFRFYFITGTSTERPFLLQQVTE